MNCTRILPLFLSIAAAIAFAQTPAPAPPSDPGALLQLAADSNGLHGAKAKPWHMHATWKSIDAQGQITGQGTLEEWWAAETRYKLIYTDGEAQQTIYGTGQGRMAVKTDVKLSFAINNVESLFTWPAPPVTPDALKRMQLERSPWQTGGVTLDCVLQSWKLPAGTVATAMDKSGKVQPLLYRYCFDRATAVLRIRTNPTAVTTFNSLVQFQGQYVARAILSSLTSGGKLEADVDALESLDSIGDADVTPPAGAGLVPSVLKVAVSSGVMAGNRIGGRDPAYPIQALDQRVHGVVVLKAVILTDGTISDLTIVSGDPLLQQAALDAVKTWRYKPYLLNGQPVEVETQINVVFAMGR
jgi:TonB family protein